MGLDNTFIKNAVENINRINGNETLLDLLLEFEKILDETGIYAYKNWASGEVVEYLHFPLQKHCARSYSNCKGKCRYSQTSPRASF